MKIAKIEVDWLANLNKDELKMVLLEYRYLVHRFTPWIGLLISKTNIDKVRQLLMPNFVEESGCSRESNVPHLTLLDNLLKSVGIEYPENYTPTENTFKTEKWFYNLFDSGNTYKGLCVIGPATEAISHQFLMPLKDGICTNFATADMTYFDVHLSELEDEHAKSIDDAIDYFETLDKSAITFKTEFIQEGIKTHSKFWKSIKSNLSDN